MIANFFNKTKPINFLVLSFLVFLVYIIAVATIYSGDSTLSHMIRKGIFLIASILIIFVLNFIIRKNSLTDNNTYALLFYILFIGFFPFSILNGKIFLANLILLFAFRRIYSLRTSIRTKQKIFDSAFWIGIASLLYTWSFIYLLLLYIAIWIFRKMEWKNLFIPFIGFITPIFIFYSYLLAIDDLDRFIEIWQFDYSILFKNYFSLKFLIPIILLIIMVIISIFPTTKRSLMAKIDYKSTWSIIVVHIGLALLIVLIAPIKNGSEFLFLFFPLSILFANYLQNMNKYWYKEAIIYLFTIIFFSVYLV